MPPLLPVHTAKALLRRARKGALLAVAGALIGLAPGIRANDSTDARSESKWLEPERTRLLQDTGSLPFFPHRANTTHNDILKRNQFDDATVCGGCHAEIYAQWRASMMSQAWEDPIYRGMLRLASEATQGQVDNFCTGCHTPIGLTTGQINPEFSRAPVAFTAEHNPLPGVDCESCHNISARTGLDNGAYVLTPNAHGKPTKFGPRKNAVSPYHDTVYSDIHRRSDFCAPCHNVTHPFTTVAVERTYDEWLESPYSLAGEDCQSCHMPTFAGKAAVMGPDRSDVASHWFPGGNATVLEHFGSKDNAQRARAMLARAGTVELIDLPAAFTPGKISKVRIKVSNTGAGHKLPTGFPEGREVWIDLKLVDSNGREVYRLGAVKDGTTEPGTRNFKVHLGDADGHELDLEVWKAAQILSDNRIMPKGQMVEEFSFVVPADAVGPITVRADLNYWAFPQKLVDFLLGPNKVHVEITHMASAEGRVPLARGLSPAQE
jgi:hypothetical protein